MMLHEELVGDLKVDMKEEPKVNKRGTWKRTQCTECGLSGGHHKYTCSKKKHVEDNISKDTKEKGFEGNNEKGSALHSRKLWYLCDELWKGESVYKGIFISGPESCEEVIKWTREHNYKVFAVDLKEKEYEEKNLIVRRMNFNTKGYLENLSDYCKKYVNAEPKDVMFYDNGNGGIAVIERIKAEYEAGFGKIFAVLNDRYNPVTETLKKQYPTMVLIHLQKDGKENGNFTWIGILKQKED